MYNEERKEKKEELWRTDHYIRLYTRILLNKNVYPCADLRG